ncbi:hypothetical protein [Vibrio porteresiae]|uniref:Uncharacterized protein n=1 Tax=Vibrio porteresiae DSM 19223 TaxID=1123496 RepID=A0ABZ0QK37_9VIBR|nr:hypothetical protein [Vibrio porteresiae]WPC76871.1 hypothetical protein R8Z52_20305 [Vibrio porteresiae DSM 19223]
MIDFDKLYHDETYALKVLINLIDKYFTTDEEKIRLIRNLVSLVGNIPGRRVGAIFYQKGLSTEDQNIIQEIINIYS